MLVLVDHEGGRVEDLSLQAVTFARGLADQLQQPLHAVLVGSNDQSVGSTLGAYGVDSVTLANHPDLTGFAPMAAARTVVQLIEENGAQAAVAVGSDRGNEVMAHVSAMLDLPLAADCLTVTAGDPVQVTRSRWGGSLLEEADLHGSPVLLTVAPHSTEAVVVGDKSVQIREFVPTLGAADLVVQGTTEAVGDAGGVTLADAKVVVSGGRGVGGSEGFANLEELADLLGGAVGCSRVVTSAGWRPHTDQVGQTGTKVAPDLYIACGISGATQHLAGCRTSKTMLVINNDPDASILAHADYAVIGDLHTIVPAIVAETRKAHST
jgi:electron transfer flavoprotein alpha subunit